MIYYQLFCRRSTISTSRWIASFLQNVLPIHLLPLSRPIQRIPCPRCPRSQGNYLFCCYTLEPKGSCSRLTSRVWLSYIIMKKKKMQNERHGRVPEEKSEGIRRVSLVLFPKKQLIDCLLPLNLHRSHLESDDCRICRVHSDDLGSMFREESGNLRGS